jgi:hypothetical protein
MRLSKFGFASALLFIVVSLIARFLLPIGDEPDWSYRVEDLFDNSRSIISSYHLFENWISTFIDSAKMCVINSKPSNLWVYISEDCGEPLIQIFQRWIILIFISSPVIFILIFREASISIFSFLGMKLNEPEWHRRLNSVSLTLIFPGFIYYSGILGVEQQFLFLALLIFIFWGFWIPVSIIVSVLMLLDVGNALVVFWFIGVFIFFATIRRCNRRLF